MTSARDNDSFILVAHRGGLYYRPQNTLAAIRRSIESGIPWCECDIRITKDGSPVLFHDEAAYVPGKGRRNLRELDNKTLSLLDVGGGEKLPTVGEMFELIEETDLKIDFDVKELDVIDPLVNLISDFKMVDRVLISSFVPEILQLAAECSPNIDRGLLVDRLTGTLVDVKSAVHAAKLLGCRFILLHHRIVHAEWIEAARSERLKIISWTVNKHSVANRLVSLGIDGLISDRPDEFVHLINKSLNV